MRPIPFLISLLMLTGLSIPAFAAQPVTSVPALDISRYAGQWHEIAHLPNRFQEDCAGDITAGYTLRGDGHVGVRNACTDKTGAQIVAEGEARPVKGHPGQLEVRFAPKWLAWLPLVWADYWVIDLDPDYTWAVVGEPGREYFWILSREPSMDRTLFEAIKLRAAQLGYDLSDLAVTGTLR
ncbi:apolipoprotein D and lipocalin family protein [Pseudoxanthomonas sp. GM95]|uniref:lipocalin family protein n=1 Tax=Pseudoxanthomonas sp. GM95 TaxID=1881043 RepID=UPI0008D89D91|nr:lipocalin family protein [Pseudoxanthomonas sp. GM95]SEK81081.1 apolipoprotein D and lipocalin family protein [Pseudoxanthomonas sp. GM95]